MTEKTRTENPGAEPVQAGAPATPSVDQVRPLSELAKHAEAIDAGAPAAAPGLPAVVASAAPSDEKTVREVSAMLRSLRNAADPLVVGLGYMEEGQVAALWGDDTLTNIAEPLVEILKSAGWSGDMGKFGPWIALVMAAGAPVAGTIALVKVNRAAALAAPQGQSSGQQQSA